MGDLAGPVSESALPKVAVLSVLIALCLLMASTVASASATVTSDAGNVTVYRATDGDFDDAAAVEAAVENGSISPTDAMVAGETLVVGLDSERLADSLAAGNGSTTRRFFDVLDGEAEFRIVQTNMDSHSPPKAPRLGPDNVTIYRDGTTTYVVVETGALEFPRYLTEKDTYEPAGLSDGDRFAVEFGYDLDDVPFHGASEYDPAGPEVTLYSTKSGLPETRTVSASVTQTETPGETATATLVGSPTNETTNRTPSTTGEDGTGFTLTGTSVALLLLVAGAARRSFR